MCMGLGVLSAEATVRKASPRPQPNLPPRPTPPRRSSLPNPPSANASRVWLLQQPTAHPARAMHRLSPSQPTMRSTLNLKLYLPNFQLYLPKLPKLLLLQLPQPSPHTTMATACLMQVPPVLLPSRPLLPTMRTSTQMTTLPRALPPTPGLPNARTVATHNLMTPRPLPFMWTLLPKAPS